MSPVSFLRPLPCCFSALGSRIPQGPGPYLLEVTPWGRFSGICLGKEDCIVYAGKDVVALQTPIFKDTSMANVIVHLGWREK